MRRNYDIAPFHLPLPSGHQLFYVTLPGSTVAAQKGRGHALSGIVVEEWRTPSMTRGTCWPCGLGPGLDSCQLGEAVTSRAAPRCRRQAEPWEGSQDGNQRRHKVCIPSVMLQDNRDKLGLCCSVILTLETIQPDSVLFLSRALHIINEDISDLTTATKMSRCSSFYEIIMLLKSKEEPTFQGAWCISL